MNMMRGAVQFRADKLVVLIDAENTSPYIVEPLLKEISTFGTAYVKRVYGDWTSQKMSSWKNIVNHFALVPIQQFTYTTGKNATDSALIIDAMDILYTDNLDGFCLVSSDSDFTRLAHRIRQNGINVYGFGKKSTPQAFKASCDRFVNTDLLHDSYKENITNSSQSQQKQSNTDEKKKTANPSQSQEKQNNASKVKDLDTLLIAAYKSVSPQDGKAPLGEVGQQIRKIDPAFDPKHYGHKKLKDLLKANNLFKVKGNEVLLGKAGH